MTTMNEEDFPKPDPKFTAKPAKVDKTSQSSDDFKAEFHAQQAKMDAEFALLSPEELASRRQAANDAFVK